MKIAEGRRMVSMATVATIIIILLSVSVLLILYLAYRNYLVYKYRTQLIDQLCGAGNEDIKFGRDPSWREKEFNKVSYCGMVYEFWKPLDSFYPDKSFLKFDGNK